MANDWSEDLEDGSGPDAVPAAPAPSPPPPAPAAAPAPLTPAQQAELRARIDARRSDPAHPVNQPLHRQHAAAQAELEGMYKQLYGTGPASDAAPQPGEADPAAEEPVTTVVAADLPAGYEWHEETLNALGNLATAEEIDPGLLREGTALVSRLLHERAPVLSGEEAEAVLARRWGRRYEYQIARATETWNLLPKRVQDDLTKSGIRYHPELAEFLLKVGESMWDPSTPGGVRRLREKWAAKAASEEARNA